MAGNDHLQVPGPSFAAINTGTGDGDGDGAETTRRTRSNSTQSNTLPAVDNIGGGTDAVDYARQSTIRISHQPSRGSLRASNTPSQETPQGGSGSGGGGYFGLVRRNRSISAPTRPAAPTTPGEGPSRPTRQQSYMPDIQETPNAHSYGQHGDGGQPLPEAGDNNQSAASAAQRLRHARTNIHERRIRPSSAEYEDQLVDFLDVVDPEVSTLTTLTNVQNSLFVPDFGKYGRFINRRPTYQLTRPPTISSSESSTDEDLTPAAEGEAVTTRPGVSREPTGATMQTITSRVNDKFYAVLPHGVELKGWSEEDKLELNDHVRHMLHSRRSKFRRRMRGFGQYVRKPLGFFVTLYATLITVFGLAWVLFLIGWINVQGRQEYLVHIIDSVLVALFGVVGYGMAPFRTVDTYHMCFIAHYHHLTWRLRREQALPKLQNKSDLPGLPPNSDAAAAEKATSLSKEYSVLTPEQQKKLEHHQNKFSKSHSFYKPHETSTHFAFSLELLVAVVVLLDCHSLLQISLGATTWGIDYRHRHFAITTVILCVSITVNITAGILISVGDKKSRKKDVIERLERQALTEEALRKVERRREKEVRMDLERRGLADDEEEVRRIVSPQPIVIARSSLEVRREMEQQIVKRDQGPTREAMGILTIPEVKEEPKQGLKRKEVGGAKNNSDAI